MNVLTSTHQVSDVGAWYREQELARPFHYRVIVCKLKGELEVMMGHIVTHLSLDDYCDLHGLQMVELLRGTRHALPHERTELI